ncbi:regulatory ArsR family protein [Streptomyces sp. 1114.5]|uniref:ArsR/SmtB family transcription factor n=1 Tax=unclassified Streptomyces TaxID=2593676 RepID=UPI000BCB39C2|nr:MULTISPECIES: winged helix-turn-helix domain-containing protein [unclassified Streptomyces]RKT19671.1 regulatory ArsR family protein [Streptomyces sp. 1114.5]SOB85868.1 regulatory protein, arsR family [Streptomyces sp. 1331.2]
MAAELLFTAGDLARMRFAVCPMWEVGPSLRLLGSGLAHPVHRPWAEQVRPRLATLGPAYALLAELVPPAGYVPDFLNPTPAGPAPTLDEELAAIRATPTGQVRRELDRLQDDRRQEGRGGLGPRLRALYTDPAAGLGRLTEAVEAYWELALAPYWARIRAVLDADVLHRARQAAEHGAAHALNDLHTELRWTEDTLRLRHRTRPLPGRTAGAGLLLVPSAFTGPALYTRLVPPDPLQLAYPARGIGSLWTTTAPVAGTEALAAVLGRSRARLLTELVAPASTTELAQRTGLSASAVSQYLTALRDAHLVSAHRAGRSVLYARTASAEALLAPLGER